MGRIKQNKRNIGKIEGMGRLNNRWDLWKMVGKAKY